MIIFIGKFYLLESLIQILILAPKQTWGAVGDLDLRTGSGNRNPAFPFSFESSDFWSLRYENMNYE